MRSEKCHTSHTHTSEFISVKVLVTPEELDTNALRMNTSPMVLIAVFAAYISRTNPDTHSHTKLSHTPLPVYITKCLSELDTCSHTRKLHTRTSEFISVKVLVTPEELDTNALRMNTTPMVLIAVFAAYISRWYSILTVKSTKKIA